MQVSDNGPSVLRDAACHYTVVQWPESDTVQMPWTQMKKEDTNKPKAGDSLT